MNNIVLRDYTSLNVLYSTNTKSDYIPPIPLSMQQVVCGPHWKTLQVFDRYVTMETPTIYDIAALAARLPATQTPDLVVVRTDANMFNMPFNLAGLRCPKLLLLGDTHHCADPIRTVLRYLDSEKFDFVVVMYDKHHVHWLREAGHDNVYFIPGLDVEHFPVEFPEQRERCIAFVGQSGKHHPRRKWHLDQMALRGYPLRVQMTSRQDSARVYAQSQISFNCSLNGDLNMRVFEVLGAGGFLLTDRLSAQADLDQLFEDGRHLVCYRDQNDLFAKLDYYLAHPDEALAIARQGQAEYLRKHLPEHRVDALLRLIFEGERPGGSDFSDDPRTLRPPAAARTELLERAAIYEYFQELQRHQETMQVLCFGADLLAGDLADLCGLELAILQTNETLDVERDAQAHAGVSQPLQILSDADARSRLWDALVVDAGRLGSSLEGMLAGYRCRRLVFPGAQGERLAALTRSLAAGGWRPLKPDLPLFDHLPLTPPVRTAPAAPNSASPSPWKWG